MAWLELQSPYWTGKGRPLFRTNEAKTERSGGAEWLHGVTTAALGCQTYHTWERNKFRPSFSHYYFGCFYYWQSNIILTYLSYLDGVCIMRREFQVHFLFRPDLFNSISIYWVSHAKYFAKGVNTQSLYLGRSGEF